MPQTQASEESLRSEIDRIVEEQMLVQHIPAVSIGIVQDGRLAYTKAYGLADVELEVAATEHNLYQIGSITKTFTGTAMMMLVQEGKLSLEQAVTDLLEEAPKSWSGVNLRHLLTHTSGIKSYTSLEELGSRWFNDVGPKELIALVSELPLEFEPGAQYAYNNTGYFLLGMIIEEYSGQAYASFLKERIFDLLGMDGTFLDSRERITKNRCKGYNLSEDIVYNAPSVSMTWPFSAGALVSTASDLSKWDLAQSTDLLLPAKLRSEMTNHARLNDGSMVDYGLGWRVMQLRGVPVTGHGGGIPGFRTTFMRYPEQELSVIVLCNLTPSSPEAIASRIAGTINPKLIPVSMMDRRDDPLPQLTRSMATALQSPAGWPEASILLEAYRKIADGYSEDRRKEIADWASVEFQYLNTDLLRPGLCERCGAAIQHIRYYRTHWQDKPIHWSVCFTADDLIADVQASAGG